nr:MAG TPA: hypothetical protein [Caudoviricetes sp.]
MARVSRQIDASRLYSTQFFKRTGSVPQVLHHSAVSWGSRSNRKKSSAKSLNFAFSSSLSILSLQCPVNLRRSRFQLLPLFRLFFRRQVLKKGHEVLNVIVVHRFAAFRTFV